MSVALRLLERRRSGVLLHPTSLLTGDGADARGALGAAARGFIDWLAQAGFSIWQVLPLGPPGGGGSPYWARSDFAGQASMIDCNELPDLNAQHSDFESFRAAHEDWLEDYVLFEAMADRFKAAWWDWPEQFRARDPKAMYRFARESREQLERRRLEQWQFDWQWRALRGYAAARGVFLFGDLPIYVAPDSVATWAARAQFQLDADGRPALLAGVPPDYFSADGQLWGNPLYDWGQAERDGFSFWRTRLAHQLQRFDLVRIDHFRGLAGYWAVPAAAKTAREGRWCPAPGQALFQALRADFPDLPLVAEDLGVITPDVEQLRVAFHLPGMRVLQFGFDGSPDNPHLPHNYLRDVVAYTGTHDNDTTVGWYRSLERADAQRVEFYLRTEPAALAETMARAVLASVAQLAVIPVQDLLQLGSQARFNTPGTATGNWSWRLPVGSLTAALAVHFASLNHVFGRTSGVGRA
ncbi:MAG: 4-alpha-glucanotransferase [Steroidobacteraceae bacterium]|jgi:4-alpha-glucanotransferase